MQERTHTYGVQGGFHAFDPATKITTFGRTNDEALAKLEEARLRRSRLMAVKAAGVNRHE